MPEFYVSEQKKISVNLFKYKIDWDVKVSRGKFGALQWDFKQMIRQFWGNHIVYEEFKLPKSRKSIDFLNMTLRIAVEVQGKQHTEYSEFFHGNRIGYYNQKKRDMEKLDFCRLNNIELVEIFQDEVISPELLKSKGLIQ